MKQQIRWLLAVLGLTTIAWVSCQGDQSRSSERKAGGGQTTRGWVAHDDPIGFSVETPREWTVRGDRASGRAELQGPGGEQLVVWPVFIPVSLETTTASASLRKLAAKLWPDTQWESPEPAGAAAIRLRGRAGNRVATALFTWISSSKGSAAYVYGMTAPEAHYRQVEDTFARILQSFRITGPPTQEKQPPAPNYIKWQDPRENAFSLEVPGQWKVNGGLFRFASVDTRPVIEAISPDGKIRISGGDAEIPPFTVPNPTLAMAGFREGSWYSPGYGVNMMVRRYMPGKAFAQEYAMTKLTKGCADATITESRDRPDAVQAINAIYSQYGNAGIVTNLTAGEVAFTCRKDSQLMQGYYLAGTQSTQGYGFALWHVEILYGYLAASGQVAQAQSVLGHMLKTFQLNPQWVAMQQNIAANTSQIVSRTSEEISNIISSSYWNRQGVMDEISRRRSNAILGVEDVTDPVTGREIKVESGSNYYWIDHRGIIVGTDTDTRPTIDFRGLTRLP